MSFALDMPDRSEGLRTAAALADERRNDRLAASLRLREAQLGLKPIEDLINDMKGLTPAAKRCLIFVGDFHAVHRRGPSYPLVAAALGGKSLSAANRVIVLLLGSGRLVHGPGRTLAVAEPKRCRCCQQILPRAPRVRSEIAMVTQ